MYRVDHYLIIKGIFENPHKKEPTRKQKGLSRNSRKPFVYWSERLDLNQRATCPPDKCATRLRHAPFIEVKPI